MEFEYDDIKSISNKKKHGIDFIEAQKLWNNDNKIIYPARSETEERYILISTIENKHWSAIYTVRNQKVRLISVRRSRKEEEVLYEG
ncbi:MAG: BrnT family toxin [Spirochaetes bacterium]|nr:MAG: BrnT family toxin [Spirochaetota bacterium]